MQDTANACHSNSLSRFQVACPIAEKGKHQTDQSNSPYSVMFRYSLHLIGPFGNSFFHDGTSIGYTMRMRGYRIYTTEGEARGRVYSMTPNPNCITGLYQNAEAFPFSIGSS